MFVKHTMYNIIAKLISNALTKETRKQFFATLHFGICFFHTFKTKFLQFCLFFLCPLWCWEYLFMVFRILHLFLMMKINQWKRFSQQIFIHSRQLNFQIQNARLTERFQYFQYNYRECINIELHNILLLNLFFLWF